MCTYNDVVATGAVDGSLAIMSVRNTKSWVRKECLLQGVGIISHIECDLVHMLVSTFQDEAVQD